MPDLESALIEENTTLWEPSNSTIPKDNAVQQRIASGELLRILGPCSLQSVTQIEAMLSVIDGHVDVLRAPAKKPRTRPVSAKGQILFEGIGIPAAIPIYELLRLRHPGLGIASEVMSGTDLRKLSPWLDLPWIGSRTQPQETCRDIGHQAALNRLPVMVKNPMVSDLELMLGMIENAILGAECSIPILLCLRGTEPTESTDTTIWRNKSNLQLVSKVRAAFPKLPIMVDPSHMLNKTALTPQRVVDLVKQGVDQGANGYIIELHTPEHPSLTDPGTDAYETLNLLAQANLA